MNPQNITRMMIDTAVRRGIEQMHDDPKRSIRKMADMGKQFSSGRFQETLMDIFHTLLENDDSPYYDMVENFLDNTDHKNIRIFGINMGYNSWTYGARILRSKSEELGVALPWVLTFYYDPSGQDGITLDTLRRIINEARPLGIYSFSIVQEGGVLASDELISLFSEYSDCGFFYFLANAQVTAAQISALKKCGNALLVVDVSGKEHADPDSISHNTCEALRAAKALYGIHYRYDDSILADQNSEEEQKFTNELLSYNSSLIFISPAEGASVSLGEEMKALRLEQRYPCFIWDWPYDVQLVNKIICDQAVYVEFALDGTVRTPSSSLSASVLDDRSSLTDILSQVCPRYIASGPVNGPRALHPNLT